jgi:hypothetical protein
MQTLQLTQFQLRRPSKVQWLFPPIEQLSPNPSLEESRELVLNHIVGKALRKALRRTDEHLQRENITWEIKPVSEQEFLDWLPSYRTEMVKLGYDILANPEWYPTQLAEERVVKGIFFFQNGQPVASGMIQYQEDKEAALAFRINERIDFGANSHTSMGHILDYLYISEMVHRKIPIVSGGRSFNQYFLGKRIGYISYKTRFYCPAIARKFTWEDTIELGPEGVVLGYCAPLDSEKLTLHIFHPAGKQPELPTAAFSRSEIETVFTSYQPD